MKKMRLDLRHGACFPYVAAVDQGEAQSCVAHAFGAALYCLKVAAGLPLFPHSGLGHPEVEEAFRGALAESPDPARGTSFHAVLARLLARHGEDLKALGWRAERLPGSAARVRRALEGGAPVVAGYQANEAMVAFQRSPDVCARHGYLLPSLRADPRVVSAHAVLLVGYDDDVGSFLARNSWGRDWGVDGHFLVRYEDVDNAAHFTDLVGFGKAGRTSPTA